MFHSRFRSRFRSIRSWFRWRLTAGSFQGEGCDPFPFCSTAFIDRLEVL